MAFDLQRFYRKLDEHYASQDREAMEEFLLASRESAKNDGTSSWIREGCSGCAPSSSPNAALIAVCNELACFYRGISRWEESLEAFSQAQQELEMFYQVDTVQYATILLNKAGTYRYMGQPADALELFHQAEVILTHQMGASADVLAGLYNNTGLAHLDLGQPQEALDRFRQALALIEDNDAAIVEQGSTWNNLAAAYRGLGQMTQALEAMNRSVSILEKMDCGKNPHYPAALNTRGIFHYHQGAYEEALADFIAALEITALVFGENIEYSYGCENCYAACSKLSRPQEAQAWLDKANAIRERLKRV